MCFHIFRHQRRHQRPYDAIPTGVFAATMMRADLDRAAKAMAEGDVVEMMRVYQSLKEYSA
jgi:hypothetical protein